MSTDAVLVEGARGFWRRPACGGAAAQPTRSSRLASRARCHRSGVRPADVATQRLGCGGRNAAAPAGFPALRGTACRLDGGCGQDRTGSGHCVATPIQCRRLRRRIRFIARLAPSCRTRFALHWHPLIALGGRCLRHPATLGARRSSRCRCPRSRYDQRHTLAIHASTRPSVGSELPCRTRKSSAQGRCGCS